MQRGQPFHLMGLIAAMAIPIPLAHAFVPERTDPDHCSGNGADGQYSKCVAQPSTPTGSEDNGDGKFRYCLPLPAAENSGIVTLPSTLTIQRRTSNSSAIAVLQVENCRAPVQAIQGTFSLVVDNSKSTCWNKSSAQGTDCTAERTTFAKEIVADLFLRDTLTPPAKLGLVSYAGRDGTSDEGNFANDTKYKIDPVYNKTPCRDNSATNPWTGSARVPEIWEEKSDTGLYYSRCELIPPVEKANQSLLESFIDFTGANSRGATDLTYPLEAIKRIATANAASPVGKNAVVITDGLPNIPRRIPREVCEKSPILMEALTKSGEKFEKERDASGNPTGREYCFDRQFKRAGDLTNQFAEGLVDFDFNATSDPDRFKNINVYNLLFVSDGLAYSDQDYETGKVLYPSDFLIENSSRTGNGKVKFGYVRGYSAAARAEVRKTLLDVFAEHFDAHALHHVEVKVTPAGASAATYNAVSTAEFEKGFSIKLIGLADGANTVEITALYNDGQSLSQTLTVTVNAVAAYTSETEVSCEDASTTKTVDGDDPASTRPMGDGVLPFANSSSRTQCRVFRNSDSGNNLNPSDFYNPVSADSGQSTRAKAARLRIQGGTGNCGVVAIREPRSLAINPVLMLLPFLGILALRRKRR